MTGFLALVAASCSRMHPWCRGICAICGRLGRTPLAGFLLMSNRLWTLPDNPFQSL